MGKVLNMTYVSSLTNLCEINSSFDNGVLRIAYAGTNRNNSSISKQAFENAIQTIYNCPIVCSYDREKDELGGHDIEVYRDAQGTLQLVNMTTPVGVIPESAKVWWDTVTEDDGTEREYLYAEALLWKRQEAYQKIKRDGITAQSMEITVKDGDSVDGVYQINDFEFTAFALIGVEPCFESASIEVFSKQEFKEQFSEMMRDLKESFSKVNTAIADDNITHPLNYETEGGETVLEEKKLLLEKYEIDPETLDFSIDDFTVEELTEKFEAMKAQAEAIIDEIVDEIKDKQEEQVDYALDGAKRDELARVLREASMVEDEWGVYPRYCFEDCDFEIGRVYAWDVNDWRLYGFGFEPNGDSFKIDFDSKKRMKYVIADFDEGEQASPFAPIFNQLREKVAEGKEVSEKYQAAIETISTMKDEMESLKQFKADTEAAIAEQERDNVFSKFEDLAGVEAFEALREHKMEFDVETLEEKCNAIWGKNNRSAKFSVENKAPVIVIPKSNTTNEPYGGIFVKYGIESNKE